MQFTDFYISSVAGSIVIALLIAGVKALRQASEPVLWKLRYPYIPTVTGDGATTRLEAIIVCFLVLINVFCLMWRPSVEGITRRSASLSIANLMCTVVGARMNVILDSCNIDLVVLGSVHRWMGRLVLMHASAHIGIVTSMADYRLGPLQYFTGLIAIIVLMLILLSAQAQRWSGSWYEFFVVSHLGLTVIFMVVLSMHAWNHSKLVIAICLGIFFLSRVLIIGQLVHRSLIAGKATEVEIRSLNYNTIIFVDAAHIKFKIPKKIDVTPGKYVYLRFSGLSLGSVAQSHPFYICWWTEDDDGGMTLEFIVQRRSGLSKLLQPDSGGAIGQVFMEGPFGREANLGSRQIIIFCATGVGIAAILPFIRQALEHGDTTDKKLRVYWVVDKQVHLAWAKDFITELLQRDIHKLLRLKLLIRGERVPHVEETGDRLRFYKMSMGYWKKELRDPTAWQDDKLTIEGLIANKIDKQRSTLTQTRRKSLVILCANTRLSRKIRLTVAEKADAIIHELSFQPDTDSGRSQAEDTGSSV